MIVFLRSRAVFSLVAAVSMPTALTAEVSPATCNEDAMIVFDASGSMAGSERKGTSVVTRIDKVRMALSQVLPEVAPMRRLGLITYGPGPYNKCDSTRLELEPEFDASDRIMGIVDELVPTGRTPLTAAVEEAADVLRYKEKPSVVVLVTDGEETCGGDPCALAERLKTDGKQITVHVVGYRLKNFSWTGTNTAQAKCLPEKTGGQYISVQTSDELVAALRTTLGCPQLTLKSMRSQQMACYSDATR